MKRSILVIMVAIVLAFLLSSCGDSKVNNSTEEVDEGLKCVGTWVYNSPKIATYTGTIKLNSDYTYTRVNNDTTLDGSFGKWVYAKTGSLEVVILEDGEIYAFDGEHLIRDYKGINQQNYNRQQQN